MNQLQRRALAIVPLSVATVQDFYDGSHSGTEKQCLRALCESHERLRAEVQGCEILLAEAAKVRAKLAAVLALTDTGSAEFKAAFPPRSVGEAINPREIVSGWRVVEKIRELLLEGELT